jgi:hypothetical protein
MDTPERSPTPCPPHDAGETSSEQEGRATACNVVPFARTILPFARKNYSYPPAPPSGIEDAPHPSGDDNDPGPSAA